MRQRDGHRWSPPRLTRRRALGLGAGAVASTLVGPGPTSASLPTRVAGTAAGRRVSVADSIQPAIRPRSDWGSDLDPKGDLVPEDDVRFLLVHHTASTNEYGPDGIIEQIRGWYDFHTGPEKGWPDIAYNFFVDRYGGIWEARTGSLDGPVRGDATGGSQGFALLCCSIGDHTLEPMTPEATDSMVRLLAWLGERHQVDTTPGSTVTFTSRGSSRWAAGTEVTANTIAGHRDMSTTTCPGDFLYGELAATIPAAVTQIRLDAGGGAATGLADTTPSSSTETTGPSTTEPTIGPTTTEAADVDPPPAVGTGDAGPGTEGALTATPSDDDERSPVLIGTGLAAGAVAAAGALVTRLWRRSDPT